LENSEKKGEKSRLPQTHYRGKQENMINTQNPKPQKSLLLMTKPEESIAVKDKPLSKPRNDIRRYILQRYVYGHTNNQTTNQHNHITLTTPSSQPRREDTTLMMKGDV
jgi:hypothetical protein